MRAVVLVAVALTGSAACSHDCFIDGLGCESVSQSLGRVTAVAAGNAYSCVLTELGPVVCWGIDGAETRPPPGRFGRIAASEQQVCAAGSSLTPTCWGPSASTPLPREGSAEVLAEIAVGPTHACQLDYASLACWGSTQLVITGADVPTTVAAGYGHICHSQPEFVTPGITTCVGINDRGQATPPTTTWFTQLIAGDGYTCGVVPSRTVIDSGTVTCWGTGISPPPRDEMRTISGGARHACGVRTIDAAVVCWGDDRDGQASPPSIMRPRSLAAGTNHTCAVTETGVVVCWGSDEHGQSTPPR